MRIISRTPVRTAGLLVGLLLLITGLNARTALPDSLGIVVEGGKTFVIHQVDPGETLFALSRRYKVGVAEIQSANAMNDAGLRVGQKLKIPRPNATPPTPDPVEVVENPTSGGKKVHVVQKGETLFGISRLYNLSVEELTQINDLGDSGIREGQTLYLSSDADGTPSGKPTNTTPDPDPETKPNQDQDSHTVKAGETLYGIARMHGMSVTELKKLNRLESGAIAVGQVLKIRKASPDADGSTPEDPIGGNDAKPGTGNVEPPPVKSNWVIPPGAKKELYKDPTTGKNYFRVTETGTGAQLLNGAAAQAKFSASHKFLPKGSVVFVECPPTKQTVLLKIEGQLPADDEHVIRLSQKAMEYLLMEGAMQVVLKYSLPEN